jgi:peptide/nickel transport system permease protein
VLVRVRHATGAGDGVAVADLRATRRRVRVRRHLGAVIGGVQIAVIVVAGLVGPLLIPYESDATDLANVLKAPSLRHPFGTDELGRDVLSRVLGGVRISVVIGCAAVALGVAGGLPLGTLAAYSSGRLSDLLIGLGNILLTFPTIILAITIVSVIGIGVSGVIVAGGIAMMPAVLRLTHASVLAVRQEDYVEAARAIGGTDFLIMRRYLLPNSLSPLIVQATLGIGGTILTAAGLGFIGLGVQPPTPELGTMLSQARGYIIVAPHMAIFPGLVVAVLVLGFNLLGDGLRDALDPHQRSR